MKRLRVIIPITLGLCLGPQTSCATDFYVTDSFKITLRTGPNIQNKIITLLRSGQPVEVLESQDDWSRVRLLERGQDNMEGWVLSRYLITRQPWEIEARSLKQENSLLKEKLARIERKWKEGSLREQGLARGLKENTQALRKLQNEYGALKRGAANYLKLKEELEAIRATLKTTQKTAQTLTKENERLSSSQRNKWLATGALVLLFGLMIGLVVGRQQKKRKSLLYD